MTDSRPLICTSLHLPPDPQPFLRIHEISLYIFLPNLDHLRLALAETKDINPEATQFFHETRKVLREELLKVFKVLQFAQEVARRYHKVLKALEEKKPTQRPLYEVGLGAEMGMVRTEEAQKAMSVFRRELEKAVDRVTTTTSANKRGSKSLLTSAKNVQSVSEILSAINECNGLLQQCHAEFWRLVTQTQNENSIDSDPPSEEETQVMRAKWQTYLDTVKDVWRHGHKITDEILFPSSDIRRGTSRRPQPKQKVPSWRALFQRKDQRDFVRSKNVPEISEEPNDPIAAVVTPSYSHEIQTSAINEVDAMEGPGTSESIQAPNAAPVNGPTSNNSKAPFWRKVFRHINRNNFTHPPNAPGKRLQASNGTPDILVPSPKVAFWREFSRYAFQ